MNNVYYYKICKTNINTVTPPILSTADQQQADNYYKHQYDHWID